MKIKKIYIIIFLLITFNESALSQNKIFLNPGIKLGYAVGSDEGFIFGFEVSLVSHDENTNGIFVWGGVVSFDMSEKFKKFHAGIEFGGGYGVDIGPTFTFAEDETYSGFSVTPYLGAGVVPYVSYTFVYKRNDIYEIGTYLKLPLQLKGPGYKLYH